MPLKTKFFVDRFPGVTDAGSFPVGKGYGVNRVGVLVVEYKDVLIAAA